ncbi:MAG: portal protein, partial [Sedimentisphaerales bacterium]|nr:portal protein [Sedimentisphaerales bacterium]
MAKTKTVTQYDDIDVSDIVNEFRSDGEAGNADDFDRMEKCQNFKVGKQWDDSVLEYNKAHGKFSLTINRILPTVLQLCGSEIQNRKDVRVYGVKGSSDTVANILTQLAKQAMESNNAQFEKSQMFDDGITTAKGYIGLVKDFTEDPISGNFIIKKLNPFNVIPDPNAKEYDLNKSGKFIIHDEWLDKGLVEATYPDADLANSDFAVAGQGGIGRFVSWLIGRGKKEDGSDLCVDKYRYRVSSVWWKRYTKGFYVIREDMPLNPLFVWRKADVTHAKEFAKTNGRVELVDAVVPVLMRTVMVGGVMCEHEEDPFDGVNLYPIVPFYPYYSNGYAFGVVENLIGSQEEENWAHSQALNLIKKLANSGWKVGKLIGGYGKVLEEDSRKDGFILDMSQTGGTAEKIEPNNLSQGHMYLADKAAQNIAEISNTRLENPSFDKQNMSGRAIALKQQGSMTGSATLFSNYDYTMQIFSTLLIEIIRNCNIYSEAEIIAILDENDLLDKRLLEEAAKEVPPLPPPPADIVQFMQQAQMSPEMMQSVAGQVQAELETYQEAKQQYEELVKQKARQLIFEEIKNIGVGRYNTKVDQSPNAPTARMMNFAQLMDIEQVRPGQ